MSDTTRNIHYKFQSAKNNEQDICIQLDNKSLDLVQDPQANLPDWTKLSYHKCPNCPLDEKTSEHCPIAVNLVDKIDFFNQPPPDSEIDVTVEMPERTYRKKVDFNSALRSILGIYMVTSGCPIMDKLRSMVRFHLPFATRLETTYRSISYYLIAQYLINKKGNSPDWALKNLGPIYKNIDTVNRHFRERLKEAGKQNYSENTFFALDIAVDDVNRILNEDTINQIESLFYDHSQQEADEPLTFQYQFQYGNKEVKEFTINIDSKNLTYINHQKDNFPQWTELKCNKCPNCPLDEEKHKYCPAATAVSETIEFFRETLSTDEGTITIKSASRDYSKQATVSDGVSAMMGLVMASSGCPILSRLKPLVRQHLPFATQEETAYRSLGMYLFSQSFKEKNGEQPDWKLENFTQLYKEINIINKAFCSRLRESRIEDASLNALVKLDCFAQLIHLTIADNKIKDLQQLFEKYAI